jgi:hypothetical protein
MATSDLYKVGRLVNSDTFVVRVSAAMLLNAQAVLATATGTARNLAVYTLLNPMAAEHSMVALVASDPAVLAQTSLDGTLASVENLADAEVKRVVAAKWGIVSVKYPLDPTPAAPVL